MMEERELKVSIVFPQWVLMFNLPKVRNQVGAADLTLFTFKPWHIQIL